MPQPNNTNLIFVLLSCFRHCICASLVCRSLKASSSPVNDHALVSCLLLIRLSSIQSSGLLRRARLFISLCALEHVLHSVVRGGRHPRATEPIGIVVWLLLKCSWTARTNKAQASSIPDPASSEYAVQHHETTADIYAKKCGGM